MQKEILQMKKEGHSMRIIARYLRVCRKTIRKVFEQQDQGLACNPGELSKRRLLSVFKLCPHQSWDHKIHHFTFVSSPQQPPSTASPAAHGAAV